MTIILSYLDTASPAAPSRRNDRCSLFLSSNSLQELRQLQSQTGGDVSVEVNAAPGEDLTKILNDLRCEYEQIIEKNRREVEQWYEVKVRSNAEVLPSSPSHGKGGHEGKGCSGEGRRPGLRDKDGWKARGCGPKTGMSSMRGQAKGEACCLPDPRPANCSARGFSNSQCAWCFAPADRRSQPAGHFQQPGHPDKQPPAHGTETRNAEPGDRTAGAAQHGTGAGLLGDGKLGDGKLPRRAGDVELRCYPPAFPLLEKLAGELLGRNRISLRLPAATNPRAD